jgi:hypothetical protein
MSTMNKKMMRLALCIADLAVSAAVRTNTFPASGNVGIGTTSPPMSRAAGWLCHRTPFRYLRGMSDSGRLKASPEA